MPSSRNSAKENSTRVAFCGVLIALSLVIMLLGGFIPIATYCTPLIVMLLLLPIHREFGAKWALLSYVATALLSLMLCADKEAAFLYLFIGYYPILKPKLEKMPSKVLRILAKLLFFAVTVGAMYALLCFVFRLDQVLSSFEDEGTAFIVIFFAVELLCLMLFDFVLTRMTLLYDKKLKKKLRFLRK